MNSISELSQEDHVDLMNRISERIAGCASLDEAAQRYVSVLYEELCKSIVLVRLFVAVPFGKLPESDRDFVMNLAHSAEITELINDKTPILSLLGTRGKRPEWDDRKKSQGHLGIPLASSSFIDEIPMVSRLLKELGAGIDWIDDDDTELVTRTFESMSGVFHVYNAKTETDNRGRKIIAAQEFVEAEDIKTVFGVGGCYLGTSLFFISIVFLRQFVERIMAERFMTHANKFKAATMEVVDEERIFS